MLDRYAKGWQEIYTRTYAETFFSHGSPPPPSSVYWVDADGSYWTDSDGSFWVDVS